MVYETCVRVFVTCSIKYLEAFLKPRKEKKTQEIQNNLEQQLILYILPLKHSLHSCTDADVSRCEAGVSHPANQCWPGGPDVPLAVVNVVDVSSVQPL